MTPLQLTHRQFLKNPGVASDVNAQRRAGETVLHWELRGLNTTAVVSRV